MYQPEQDEEAYATPKRPSKKRKEDSSSSSSSEESDEGQAAEDAEKIKMFDRIVEKGIKMRGLATLHVEKGDLLCTYCDKSYKRTSMLRNHIAKAHQGKGRYACDKCDKTFIERKMMEAHVEKVHEGKGFKCSKCDVVCVTEKAKKLHEAIHDNPVANLECRFCQKKTTLDRYLQEHEASCKMNPDRTKFKCPRCPKVVYQRKQLQRHLKKNVC